MMDLQTITEEIAKLEAQKPSYGVCAKLADLYIVKENLMKKQSDSYANYGRSRENYANYGRDRENYERENYARGGGRGGNYMYDDYGYNRIMEDEMEMGMDRPSRMSMPSIR